MIGRVSAALRSAAKIRYDAPRWRRPSRLPSQDARSPMSMSLVPSLALQELKENFYKKFCKQQLWPMMHYLIPLDPLSKARFDGSLWSSYVRANMAFVNRLVEVLWSLENDFVWIHDYHLLVLPSLLRKRFHRIKCGFFLHSPFPSSEIFRTFPRREEVRVFICSKMAQ